MPPRSLQLRLATSRLGCRRPLHYVEVISRAHAVALLRGGADPHAAVPRAITCSRRTIELTRLSSRESVISCARNLQPTITTGALHLVMSFAIHHGFEYPFRFAVGLDEYDARLH